MDAQEKGQVTGAAADIYQTFFVPALFAEWAPRVVDAAEIGPGQRVLDVACGTGVAACEAAGRVGPDGSVTGLDRNADMLAVAGRIAPAIDWRLGMAEALPFDDAVFDAVVSQFGLMFFDDRAAALKEMMRVLKPDGRLVVAVWDTLENSPGYAAVTVLLEGLFGTHVADAMRAPFVLGETDRLRALFESAGITDAQISSREGTARFASIEAWVHTDVKGWTLADIIDDAQYERLLAEAQRDLARFCRDDGRVAFAAPAHLVTSVKR